MKYLILFTLMLIASVGFSQSSSQCSTKTHSGTLCIRKVDKPGAKCWQHGGQTKAQLAGVHTTPSNPCGATTKAGTPCRNSVKGGGKCHLHKS